MWARGIRHHQQINKTAYDALQRITNLTDFPQASMINHFEGDQGPDAIKYKSPGQNEPRHFYDPTDQNRSKLMEDIDHHYNHLVRNLRRRNLEKAAFEASWLAHALVDGLTPAHHYPYDEEKSLLSEGHRQQTARSIGQKMTAKGRSGRETLKNNWLLWGNKGLLTTHLLFEGGVAAINAPLNYPKLVIGENIFQKAQESGLEAYFKSQAERIHRLDLYGRFYRRGWTTAIVRDVRKILLPTIITVVTVAWYLALCEAGLSGRRGSNQK